MPFRYFWATLYRRPFVEISSEHFLWFLTNDLLRFHRIFSFLTKASIDFKMSFIRSTLANLCQKMISFDAADFSERRSERVI